MVMRRTHITSGQDGLEFPMPVASGSISQARRDEQKPAVISHGWVITQDHVCPNGDLW